MRERLIATAFNETDEAHAFIGGLYAGLKRPHRLPAAPDDTEEGHYWKGGVLVAKWILAVVTVVMAYTRLGGLL